jgi:hypothetical protein
MGKGGADYQPTPTSPDKEYSQKWFGTPDNDKTTTKKVVARRVPGQLIIDQYPLANLKHKATVAARAQ